MVSDRKISRQKRQQEKEQLMRREKERAKGDDGRCKGSKSQKYGTRKSYGLVTSVICTPKISVHSRIGDEVVDELVE